MIRCAVLLPLLAAGAQAQAQQTRPTDDSNINLGGMLKKQPPKATMPAVAAPPSAWPRLDPGAVLCRTQDDLQRRAAAMRGEQVGGFDCRPIAQPTAISIVQRAGPGATQVQLTANGETGWTDAWLPAAPPPGTALTVAR